MKKNDFYLAAGIMIICVLYLFATLQLPEKAAFYPIFVVSLLIIMDIMFIIETFLKYKKTSAAICEGEKMFKDFEIKQFFFVLATSLVYIVLINILGFYVTTLIYLLLTLLGLGVKKHHSIIATIGFCIVVYLAFTVFLKVPLPTGFII